MNILKERSYNKYKELILEKALAGQFESSSEESESSSSILEGSPVDG